MSKQQRSKVQLLQDQIDHLHEQIAKSFVYSMKMQMKESKLILFSYEMIELIPESLRGQYRSRLIELGKEVCYGGTTTNTNATNTVQQNAQATE